ncbi:MAG: ATP-binding cassette domain-containing protein [Streptococcus sp.]
MFQLKQVACAYEQKKVFTGLDLEIRQGQYVMLMGENGTGKSSLISLLTGFKQEESGRILFLREGAQRVAEGQTSKTMISIVGSVSSFQMWIVSLFNCTVYDEIAFGPSSARSVLKKCLTAVQDTPIPA